MQSTLTGKIDMKVGNVIKDMYNDILVITEFNVHTNRDGTSYDYVCWNSYKHKNTSGGFRVQGYTDTKTCSCYYDSAFRYYIQSEPDEDCEKCQGTGDEPVYRQGLNDCVLLAETVTEYKKARLQQKIKTLQERLSKYE